MLSAFTLQASINAAELNVPKNLGIVIRKGKCVFVKRAGITTKDAVDDSTNTAGYAEAIVSVTLTISPT
jgi:hypothetical protein